MFNATKFALKNGAVAPTEPLNTAALTPADRWILDRLDEVIVQTTDLLGDFQFGKAAEGLYHFAWDEVCDWYLELAKVQIPAKDSDPDRIRTTQQVLGTVLDGLFRLLHPFVPFVTETLWTALTGGESLVIAAWPTPSGRGKDQAAAAWLSDIDQLATEIRRFRAAQGLPPGQRVPAVLDFHQRDGDASADLLSYGAVLTRLEPAGESFAASATLQVALATAGTVTVAVDTSSTIDVAAEIARTVKDLATAEKEVADTAAKLGNAAFVGKAPEKVVQKIRERSARAHTDVARLTQRLGQLRGETS